MSHPFKYRPEDSDVSGLEIVAEAKTIFHLLFLHYPHPSPGYKKKSDSNTNIYQWSRIPPCEIWNTNDPSGIQRTKMRKCKLCVTKNKHRNVGQYCITTCGEASATQVVKEIAFVSMYQQSNELWSKQRKMHPYLKVYVFLIFLYVYII